MSEQCGDLRSTLLDEDLQKRGDLFDFDERMFLRSVHAKRDPVRTPRRDAVIPRYGGLVW